MFADDELQDMIEVDFPNFRTDLSHTNNDDEGESDVARTPMVDIQRDGWDDDAAVRCLNLALSYHDGHISNEGYDFKPIPNKNGSDGGSTKSNMATNKTSNTKGNGEPGECSWKPTAMMKPKWAANPSEQRENND